MYGVRDAKFNSSAIIEKASSLRLTSGNFLEISFNISAGVCLFLVITSAAVISLGTLVAPSSLYSNGPKPRDIPAKSSLLITIRLSLLATKLPGGNTSVISLSDIPLCLRLALTGTILLSGILIISPTSVCMCNG